MASVIHVEPRPEPPAFDAKVRQPGRLWMAGQGIRLDRPLPSRTALEPYWRKCLPELYDAYDGTCAYVAVFFEWVTGGATVDHFAAKSRRPRLAYEWRNYRLVCSRMNSRK